MNPTPDLDAIVELRKAATPGPWRVSQFGDDLGLVNLVDGNVDREVAPLEDVDEADAAFIAAAGSFPFAALQSRLAALEGAALRFATLHEGESGFPCNGKCSPVRDLLALTPDPDSEERTDGEAVVNQNRQEYMDREAKRWT